MERFFVNFSNHPSVDWPEEQRAAAEAYGDIVDVEFPAVSPTGDHEYIVKLAEEQMQKILQFHPQAVMCQGEFCLAYEIIRRLKKADITVLAACSERKVTLEANRKIVLFEFCQFREF